MPSPFNPTEHPTDAELLRFAAPASGADVVDAHLHSCVLCRTRVAAAGNEVEYSISPEAAEAPAVAVPSAVTRALKSYDFNATPRPGDLWRLEWSGIVALVFVYAVDETRERAKVIPVAEDVAYADAATVVVESGVSPLDFPLCVWVGLERVVPLIVFDRPLGSLGAIAGDVTAVRSWLRTGKSAELGTSRLGAAVHNDLDPRITYRHAVSTPLDALAAVQDLLREQEVAAAEQADTRLSQLLRQAEVEPSMLATALQWPRQQAQALYRDTRPLSNAEADVIAALLDMDPADIAAAAPLVPVALLVKVHTPPRRRDAQRWAETHDTTAVDARWRATAGAMSASKRTLTGRTGEPDWDQLLDDFFAG